jgi:hypothetical protein
MILLRRGSFSDQRKNRRLVPLLARYSLRLPTSDDYCLPFQSGSHLAGGTLIPCNDTNSTSASRRISIWTIIAEWPDLWWFAWNGNGQKHIAPTKEYRNLAL